MPYLHLERTAVGDGAPPPPFVGSTDSLSSSSTQQPASPDRVFRSDAVDSILVEIDQHNAKICEGDNFYGPA
jgi:hypothetical protein